MVRKEYIDFISAKKTNEKRIKKINDIYETSFPEVVNLIISNSDETIFFDDGYRVMGFNEIAEAEQDLHVDFKNKKIIPLFDCGENDFIVYNFEDDLWSKFNIVDETIFKKRDTLKELLL